MNRRFGPFALAFGALALGQAQQPPTPTPTGKKVQGPASLPDRIKAIENGLRPAVGIQGQPMPGMNILDRMKHYRIPGVSVAVVNQGRIEWAKGYGVKEAGGQDPVTPETLFQAASVSKPLTSLGALALVEQGLLDLDGPVNERLKSWKIPENAFTTQEKVTLRRLLTHTAGLKMPPPLGYATTAPLPTLVQILKGESPANTPPVRIEAVPGASQHYSNQGFLVAQLLISEASGKSFADFMKAKVLDPLGMTRSTFVQPLPERFVQDAATGHLPSGAALPGKWFVYPELASSGLWSTPSDLCRLAIGLQTMATGTPHKVLSPAMAAQMLRPQVGGFGLGIGVSGDATQDIILSHGGGTEGFTCMFFAYAHRGQGAVVMTNSKNVGELVNEIMRSLAQEYGWHVFKPKEIAVAELSPEALSAFVGSYSHKDYPAVPMKVSLEKNRLVLRSPLIGEWTLVPTSETELFYVDGGWRLKATKGKDGRIEQISGNGHVLTRRPE